MNWHPNHFLHFSRVLFFSLGPLRGIANLPDRHSRGSEVKKEKKKKKKKRPTLLIFLHLRPPLPGRNFGQLFLLSAAGAHGIEVGP